MTAMISINGAALTALGSLVLVVLLALGKAAYERLIDRAADAITGQPKDPRTAEE
ncbi:hypothetical protein AB0B31_22965 [Catellatospora citrea]|uniref:hypothetical protein n=1 Tax=Catellatospora citrea TaxID=53366 RepID=UPI0034010F1A